MRLLSLLLLGLSLTACERPLDPPEDALERGRIVLGESVDGVVLGADTNAVRARLGPPSEIERGPGRLRYVYDEGRFEGVEVSYDLGPGGELGATSAIFLRLPYDGATDEGIGLGAPRRLVLATLGAPPSSLPRTDGLQDNYVLMTGNHVLFVYDEQNRIRSMGMAGRVP